MREEIIRGKMSVISEMSTSIMEYVPDDIEEFLTLGIVKDGIYKRLEYSLENVFDICAIMNADLKLGIPEDDENIISNLIKGGVLPEEWMFRLRNMKAFRNVLVHRYGSIDDGLSFRIIREHMNDFQDFIDVIGTFLEEHDQ